MPKHVPTFKHLIATSQDRKEKPGKQEKSVVEILANSRANSRHFHAASTDEQGASSAPLPGSRFGLRERIWQPTSPGAPASGLIEAEDGSVHPAELLRRSNAAHRQASRGVAGPAPPRSWSQAVHKDLNPLPKVTRIDHKVPVTREQLVRSCDLLFRQDVSQSSQRQGGLRLVEHCLSAVLQYLNDERMITLEEDGPRCVLSEVMREQVKYLPDHLKPELLALGSTVPEGHASRLSDHSLAAVLTAVDWSEEEIEEGYNQDDSEDNTSQSRQSWEVGEEAPSVHHLPLMLHPSPITFLRKLPSFTALSMTSINLSYSTISDLEKLVSLLPVSLRELSLCSVQIKGDNRHEIWRRGIAAIGRRFLVLRVLDLSYSPIRISESLLRPLLQPPATHLPSLRVLGLRTAEADGLDPAEELAERNLEEQDQRRMLVEGLRKECLGVIRDSGRKHWVDVIWE